MRKINLIMLVLVILPSVMALHVERSISEINNNQVEVTLKLVDAPKRSAVIVRDTIPSDLQYVRGAMYDGSDVKIILGTLTTNTISYFVQIDKPGIYKIKGRYNAGVYGEGNIKGDSKLILKPKINYIPYIFTIICLILVFLILMLIILIKKKNKNEIQ